MALTDAKIRGIKPPARQVKHFDGGGLYLLCTPSGGRLWRLKYRFDGKSKGLSLGKYPDVSLLDARQRRDEARRHLANKVDPGDVRRAQREVQSAEIDTFAVISGEWFNKFSSAWSEKYRSIISRRLEIDINPFIGTRPIAAIKAPELLAVLRRAEARGCIDMAHRLRSIPMNTQRVNAFAGTLNQRSKCHVDLDAGSYTSSRQRIEYPYELAVSQVLFIEKQGFTEVFKRSGILDELNLGLISSQGFGTRAIKKMIQDFIGRGITVYALTDCDLAGQLIAERLAGGSNTFKEKLDINLIGLTYADAKELGKLQDAEEYESNKSYVHVLARMDQDEKDFFLKEKHVGYQGKESFTYRRVELNALTMPELLDFIRAKIPKKQLRPTREQIREMISFDADALKRDAVTQYLLSQVEDHMEMLSDVDVSIDADKMADQIDHALDNGRRGEKWQHVLSSVIERRQEKAMIRLQEALGSNV